MFFSSIKPKESNTAVYWAGRFELQTNQKLGFHCSQSLYRFLISHNLHDLTTWLTITDLTIYEDRVDASWWTKVVRADQAARAAKYGLDCFWLEEEPAETRERERSRKNCRESGSTGKISCFVGFCHQNYNNCLEFNSKSFYQNNRTTNCQGISGTQEKTQTGKIPGSRKQVPTICSGTIQHNWGSLVFPVCLVNISFSKSKKA